MSVWESDWTHKSSDNHCPPFDGNYFSRNIGNMYSENQMMSNVNQLLDVTVSATLVSTLLKVGESVIVTRTLCTIQADFDSLFSLLPLPPPSVSTFESRKGWR